jgi:hypothetical protein
VHAKGVGGEPRRASRVVHAPLRHRRWPGRTAAGRLRSLRAAGRGRAGRTPARCSVSRRTPRPGSARRDRATSGPSGAGRIPHR